MHPKEGGGGEIGGRRANVPDELRRDEKGFASHRFLTQVLFDPG